MDCVTAPAPSATLPTPVAAVRLLLLPAAAAAVLTPPMATLSIPLARAVLPSATLLVPVARAK